MSDWRDMTREDFATDAPAPTLFDLAPAQVPTSDDDQLDLLA